MSVFRDVSLTGIAWKVLMNTWRVCKHGVIISLEICSP